MVIIPTATALATINAQGTGAGFGIVFFPGSGASVVQWGTSGLGFTVYAVVLLAALTTCMCLRRYRKDDGASTRARKSTVPVHQEDIRYSTEPRFVPPTAVPKKAVPPTPQPQVKEPQYSDDEESLSSYSQSQSRQTPSLLTEDFPAFSKTPQKSNFVPPLQSRLRSESTSSRNRGTLSREYASNNASRLYEENT